jgi:HK97 family phage prohead protease
MLAPSSESNTASVFAPRATIDADGTVEGYASLFGELDQARDMMMRGAFAATLSVRGIRRVPMLFQHNSSEPVGIWLELREDHRGLFARGRLIPEVARGRELLSLLRAGAIDGLSIGFRTSKARIEPRTRIRRIYAVDLWEISIVTFPMLAGARVRAVKHSHARARAEQEWARTIGRPNGANTTSLAGNPGPKRISTSSLCNGDLTGAGARRPKPDLRLAAAPRSASLSRRHHAAAGINDHVALE